MQNGLASLFPSHEFLTATLWIGVGAIAAAFITARTASSVKLSEYRQGWINALRDDLSEYITKAGEIQSLTKDLIIEHDTQKQTALRAKIAEIISKADVLRFRVLLRLNLDEADHIALANLLNNMRTTSGLAEDAVDQARRVLKREWAVAKYGILADFRLYLKRVRRRFWQQLKTVGASSAKRPP